MIDLEKTKPGHVKYIWKHLREMDRKELALFNMYDHNYMTRIMRDATLAATVRIDGKPAGIVGYTEKGGTLQVFFFGTPAISKHFREVYRLALLSLRRLQHSYPQKRISVRVWETYRSSVRWLTNMGFVDKNLTIGRPGERLRYMEWDNGIRIKACAE